MLSQICCAIHFIIYCIHTRMHALNYYVYTIHMALCTFRHFLHLRSWVLWRKCWDSRSTRSAREGGGSYINYATFCTWLSHTHTQLSTTIWHARFGNAPHACIHACKGYALIRPQFSPHDCGSITVAHIVTVQSTGFMQISTTCSRWNWEQKCHSRILHNDECQLWE